MDQSLITLDLQQRTCALTARATELKVAALEGSALIAKVNTEDDQREAVQAQARVHEVAKLFRSAISAAKDPVNEIRGKINTTEREFLEELLAEEDRISRLVGDYQQLEQAKAREAQKLEDERRSALERERSAELSQATTHEQMDAIQEKFNERAKEEAQPIVSPPRAKGQRVTEDWEVTVKDIWLLARAHPSCVNIEPRMSDIKSLLNAGIKVAGVTAEKVTKSGVRSSNKALTIT